MDKEAKITTCWGVPDVDGYPAPDVSLVSKFRASRPAVLMWNDDFDAMRKELEKLNVEVREWADYKALFGYLVASIHNLQLEVEELREKVKTTEAK